ncbi:MAG TPA: dethiobiotin synthase [Gammaproteobacteria bacterium]|nr:dethiobiotin synthase [Gammaproteobacteria bacterium]
MNRAWFVTGTDTGVGKTRVTAGLLHALARHGWRVLGLKPVASGCRREGGQWVNDDALALQAASSGNPPYSAVNPCALRDPVSPHLAAAAMGWDIDPAALADHCRRLAETTNIVVVEGVGGWRVPLTRKQTMADLARALDWPVILVVGIRLGCINHALLSAEAVRGDGLRLAGWVANHLDPACLMAEEVVATLRQRLPAPCLGVVPHAKKMDAAGLAARLDIRMLLAEYEDEQQ